MATKITILIVADFVSVRADLRTILELLSEVAVVGEATSGEEAVRQVNSCKPDLVLVDLEMNNMSGWAIIKMIKALPWVPQIYVLSAYGHSTEKNAASKIGADAFFVKGEDTQSLLVKISNFKRPVPGSE